jgi:hypothetical protein
MKSSQDIGELASALAKAQGQLLGATKDKKNPFFKSKYADLESCWASCREQLSANNISVVQMTSAGNEGEIVINTILMHESGQWIEGELPLKPVKDDPQGIGSAITYGRRYALMGAVGIAPADDDGEASMGRKQVAFITEDQAIEITELIREKKADQAKFLKYIGCHSVEKIPANKYGQAIKALEMKK